MVLFYEIETGSEGFRNGNCNFRAIVFNHVKHHNKRLINYEIIYILLMILWSVYLLINTTYMKCRAPVIMFITFLSPPFLKKIKCYAWYVRVNNMNA